MFDFVISILCPLVKCVDGVEIALWIHLLMMEPVGELSLGGRKAIDCDISKRVSPSDDVGDAGAGDADRELSDEGLRPSGDEDSGTGGSRR